MASYPKELLPDQSQRVKLSHRANQRQFGSHQIGVDKSVQRFSIKIILQVGLIFSS